MRPALKNNTDYQAPINLEDGSLYNLILIYKDEKFLFKLNQKFNPVFWENAFSLKSLASVNKIWGYFEEDGEFFEKIIQGIEEKSINILKSSENQRTFQFKIEKKSFSLDLKPKQGEIAEHIGEMVQHLRALEEKIYKLEKIQEQSEEYVAFNDFSFYTNNNNGNFSNKNKTLEKISGGNNWFGFRCDPPAKISDKMVFSIKIDNTDSNCYIMIGWCLKNANHSSGYYNTNASFGLYLHNGDFRNRSNNSFFISYG